MKPLHVIAVGEFGSAVADAISQRIPDALVTRVSEKAVVLPSDQFPVARMHVLAAWRPVAWMAKTMDKLAHSWNVPWIPVVLDHPYLRIGPVVAPKAGPCYHCFEIRYMQHSPITAHVQSMQQHYDRFPEAGPKGYLRPIAILAGAQAVLLDKRLTAGEAGLAGSVWQMNALNREGFRSQTVGVHGCPRCGLGRPEETRSVDMLSEDLKRIVGDNSTTREVIPS